MVGRSNNIPIYDDAGHSNDFVRMETLRSYFVFKEAGDKYLISSQQRGEAAGWVLKNDVEIWNTREGLKFVGQTFQRDRRRTVSAWESEVRLRNFASTRAPAFGPDYEELAQTRIGTNTRILPYPLLDTQDLTKEENYDAIKRKIHQVLIPAIVPDTVEVDMPPDRVTTMAGTVTFCVVFDATASMGRYARRFARTIESMLRDPSIDSRYAEAGFVFFRDLKDGTPHEIFQPEPLDRAMDILRSKINGMTGGDQKQEPVLDAVVLAKQSFLWSSGTVSNAKRIMIVVANEDANLLTVGLEENISKGLDALQVTRLLTTESQIPISVFALQAGKDDYGNLATVLSTLANRTGGEYFPADADERRITRDFADKVRVLVGERIGESTAIAQQVAHHTLEREDGGAIIALDVLNEELLARLKAEAGDLHIQSGGIAIKKAWLLEDENQDLYRKAILIDKEVLESLLRFFNNLVRSNLDSKDMRESTAQLLGALVGESFDEHMELQEMLEKRLGIHFTTPFLSFELERLSTLSDSEKAILRSRLESAAAALGDFMEINARRLNGGQKIWMPVNYLP